MSSWPFCSKLSTTGAQGPKLSASDLLPAVDVSTGRTNERRVCASSFENWNVSEIAVVGVGSGVGFAILHGFLQLLKINNQNMHEMGHQNSACAVHFTETAGEKSLRKAPPCMHCCQPCRQSRSGRVLSTVANLIWVDALQTCLGRLEIHGKTNASEPQCTTKAGIQRLSLTCKIKNTANVKNTQAWSSREHGTPTYVLDERETQQCRSLFGTALNVGQDRPATQYSTEESARFMSDPTRCEVYVQTLV